MDRGEYLGITEQPIFYLGQRAYQVTKRLVRSYMSPRLCTNMARENLIIGDELELEPGEDSRLIVAAVMDDSTDGTGAKEPG